MRRTTAVLAVCFCALTGCRGGVAQEPYDGVIAAARPASAAVPTPQETEAAPIASEVDVPWAIALLSDAARPTVKKPAKVVVVDAEPDVPEMLAQEGDFHLVVGPEPAAERRERPKTCSGVVKTRS